MSDNAPIAFTVSDMTCGHCAKTITGAVLAAYPDANFDVDLAAKRVAIRDAGDRTALAAVIAAEGYSPVEAA